MAVDSVYVPTTMPSRIYNQNMFSTWFRSSETHGKLNRRWRIVVLVLMVVISVYSRVPIDADNRLIRFKHSFTVSDWESVILFDSCVSIYCGGTTRKRTVLYVYSVPLNSHVHLFLLLGMFAKIPLYGATEQIPVLRTRGRQHTKCRKPR